MNARPHWLQDIIPADENCRDKYIELRARIEKVAHHIQCNYEGDTFGTPYGADDLTYLLHYITWLEERDA